MDPRTVEAILKEWRAVERDLGKAADEEDLESLEALAAALREEHRVALELRQAEMDALKQP